MCFSQYGIGLQLNGSQDLDLHRPKYSYKCGIVAWLGVAQGMAWLCGGSGEGEVTTIHSDASIIYTTSSL